MNATTPRRTRDGVYHACWKLHGGTYAALVKQSPQIRAKGPDLSEVIDELYWALFKVIGDDLLFLQPVPAFAPRLAVAKPGIRIAGWVSISSARGEFHVLNSENELWGPPSCSRCRRVRDKRTRVPLRVRLTHPASLATPFQIGMSSIRIAPESFRRLLTPSERSAFTWRAVRVEQSRRVTEPWWELRPKRYHVQCCGIKGAPAAGHCCRSCGRKTWWYGSLSHDMTRDYLAESDLARIRRSLIVEGDSRSWDILIRHSRWLELSRTTPSKGIVPGFFGLVPSFLAIATPRIIDQERYHKQFMKAWASMRPAKSGSR